MRQLLIYVFALTMGISLFSQSSHPKYGSGRAPEVYLPQTFTSTNNTRTAENYVVYLTDSYTDGWNGASFDLLVNGTVILDGATVSGSYPTGDDAIYYISVDNGDEITTVWTEGTWDNECAYGIYNHYGILVASAGTEANPTLELEYTVVHTEIANGNFEDFTPADNGWQLQLELMLIPVMS